VRALSAKNVRRSRRLKIRTVLSTVFGFKSCSEKLRTVKPNCRRAFRFSLSLLLVRSSSEPSTLSWLRVVTMSRAGMIEPSFREKTASPGRHSAKIRLPLPSSRLSIREHDRNLLISHPQLLACGSLRLKLSQLRHCSGCVVFPIARFVAAFPFGC
jgi:hypothetical protein